MLDVLWSIKSLKAV